MCDNQWNTDLCVEGHPQSLYDNATNVTYYQSSSGRNVTDPSQLSAPAMEYWERNVLELTDGIEQMGSIKYDLLACLAIAWVMVFVSNLN